jgi:signal transduction histidine kinase
MPGSEPAAVLPAEPPVVPDRVVDRVPDRVPLKRNDLLLIVAFWAFIAALTAVNAMIDPRGRGLQQVLPAAPLALALTESALWTVVTPFVFWLVGRYGVEMPGRVLRIGLLLLLGVGIAIVIDQVMGFLRFEVFFVPRPPRPEIEPIVRVRRLWFMNEFVMYIAILAAGFARDYFQRYRARREEAARLQAHTAHLQAQLADARLAALRAQLNPHFLFNTLHAVSALVERDPKGVRRMIARLSELLRTTLEGANEAEVTLAKEIEFLRRYLEIMQIRFQSRLEVDFRVDPAVEDALVPTLILQPLVENALKHGIGQLEGTGRIEIVAHRSGERIVLAVCDNGPGMGVGSSPSEGVGLRNTRDRLEQLYASEQSMTLSSPPTGGLRVEITLPYHTANDLHAAGVAAS